MSIYGNKEAKEVRSEDSTNSLHLAPLARVGSVTELYAPLSGRYRSLERGLPSQRDGAHPLDCAYYYHIWTYNPRFYSLQVVSLMDRLASLENRCEELEAAQERPPEVRLDEAGGWGRDSPAPRGGGGREGGSPAPTSPRPPAPRHQSIVNPKLLRQEGPTIEVLERETVGDSRCFHAVFTLFSRCFHAVFTLFSRCSNGSFTVFYVRSRKSERLSACNRSSI